MIIIPVVTIAIPVYNRANLFLDTIRCILSQSYRDWELIVVDDGSEEREYETVKAFVGSDPRITFVRRPDNRVKGAQTCRNMGLELAKGKYIIFFDSDDYIPPFCLEQRVNYMEEHPELDFGVFPYAEYETDPKTPEVIGGYRFYTDDLKAFVSRTLPFMVWSNIYKTESLKNKNITWDTNLKSLQDAYFNIKVLCSGLKYDYAEDCRIDYYNRTTSKGASISKGIYSPSHFDSHIYYMRNVKEVVSKTKEMGKALREGCLYVYSLMMPNYSAEYTCELITCLSDDKWFYLITRIKNILYGKLLCRLHLSAYTSRWILFPQFSFHRKQILREHRKYCASKAHINNIELTHC